MKQDGKEQKKQGRGGKKLQLYKPRKKRSVEEDAAIQYLQAQYDKINPTEIKCFKDFPLSQKTLKGLKDNNYVTPTEIQKQAIGFALQGKDILGAAKTGSGKTLAFLIPILENLFCKKWTRLDGVGAMVISPTRELAYQIYEALRKVGHLHDFSAGLIIGGQNLKFERKRMDQINILICTPGRLLQHMDENPLFDCSHLQILVLDEADRCLDMGFETTMNAIIENLPPERQTLLFSATQTKSVKDLARLSLSFPKYIAPHEQAETVTPDLLQQSYIICETGEKIGIIWSFIKNHLKQKVIVFMATCKQVKYIYELFCKLRPAVSLLALYGTLHQEKRERIYNEFCRKSNVVLFATDLASRGLDFPRVNWVIQMDCPENVDTYIHRAGRTARGFTGKGEGLLMLLPHEEKLVEDLQKNKIPINKIQVDSSKVVVPQGKIESLLSESSELKESAQRAFVSYLKSVFLMKNKEIFNVQLLDTDAYSRSLGLTVPPYIKFLKKYQYAQKRQAEENENNEAIEKLKAKTGSDEESEQCKEEESDHSEVEEKSDHSEVEEESDQGEEEEPKVEFEKGKNKESFCQFDFQNDADTNEEDVLQVMRKNINVDVDTDKQPAEVEVKSVGEPVEDIQTTTKNNAKPLTKAAVVKKLLKKKIAVNTTVKFTEDGETMDDERRDVKSEVAKQLLNVNEEYSGIIEEKTVERLEEEDKFDKSRLKEKIKAKTKEKKRKLKNKKKEDEGDKDEFGSQSESDGPDLSWLPDPDKVYGKKDGSDKSGGSDGGSGREVSDCDDDDDDESADSGDESEVDQKFHGPTKRKLEDIPQAEVAPRKLKKMQDMAVSLSVDEAEAFAMQLLQAKR